MPNSMQLLFSDMYACLLATVFYLLVQKKELRQEKICSLSFLLMSIICPHQPTVFKTVSKGPVGNQKKGCLEKNLIKTDDEEYVLQKLRN